MKKQVIIIIIILDNIQESVFNLICAPYETLTEKNNTSTACNKYEKLK